MKRYDRAYFDRWYRDPRRRVVTGAERRRRFALVLSAAEYLLDRPVRSMLDVGCGEGAWQPELRRLRPAARYVGIDPSPYVVQRFGRGRNLVPGRAEELASLPLRGPFDVIVCSDVLHYLSARELDDAARGIRVHLGGVAYLYALTSGDDFDGDHRGWRPRSALAYKRAFQRAGLVGVGLGCFVTRALARTLVGLERP